jgi:murein L,D-transpeptidase YafK
MRILFTIILVTLFAGLSAQTSFVGYQKSFSRLNDIFKRKEDTLRRQFEEKKLSWPAKNIYIRSFKYDRKMEIWVRDSVDQPYKLFKSYKICNTSGTLGPKRIEGDYQVPEGFYCISEFNPNSNYHLSLKLNYPNLSDRYLSDKQSPGGDIYIHGSCVTRGCLPLTDEQIEEVYILASYARSEGQLYIPVHIFPVVFRDRKSREYMETYAKDFPDYVELISKLEKVYYYFEKHHRLPVIMITEKGDYVIGAQAVEKTEDYSDGTVKTVKKISKRKINPQPIPEDRLAKIVDKLPQFPGGITAFEGFLKKTSSDMVEFLNEGQKKTFVSVEFIIDENGAPVWAKVIRGGNEEMNEKIEKQFEQMPAWTPAIRLDKPVAIKMTQSLMVGE